MEAPVGRLTTVRIYRNSKKSFLVGASWSHDPTWPTRLTHIYLGPFLLTLTKCTKENRHEHL